MRTAIVLVLVVAVYSACFYRASSERATNLASASSSGKKIHLTPTASRLYHLLRAGMSNSVDDDDLQSDDDNFVQKRQYDDYGHMRFGKRGPSAKDFDDYGHLRFGK